LAKVITNLMNYPELLRKRNLKMNLAMLKNII